MVETAFGEVSSAAKMKRVLDAHLSACESVCCRGDHGGQSLVLVPCTPTERAADIQSSSHVLSADLFSDFQELRVIGRHSPLWRDRSDEKFQATRS